MHYPLLFKAKGKISFASGVSQFPSENNESLFLKHNNKLFKISAKSDLVKQSRIFHILQRPRSLRDILKLVSDFKEKDVIEILQTLYKLDLIRVESKVKYNPPKGNVLSSHNFHRRHIDKSNNKSQFNSRLVLIGNGVLVKRLMTLLKDMNIKFDRIDSLQLLYEFTEEQRQTHRKNLRRSKTTLPNFSPSLSSLLDNSDLVIVAEDYHNLNLFETVNKICFKKKKPWLRISFDDNIGYMGPFVIPMKTSCFNCCELRLVTNSPYYEYELWSNKQNIPKTKLNIPIYLVDVLSALCVYELSRYLILHKKPETTDNLFVIDTEQVNLTKHKVIPHPNCVYCNPPLRKMQSKSNLTRIVGFAKSTREFLEGTNNSNYLSDKELLIQLRELIDNKTGIIQEYEKLYESCPLDIYFHHFSTATCSKPLRIGSSGQLTRPVLLEDSLITPSPSGSGVTETEAEVHTLMESVERYSNMVVDESRLVWSAYKKIEMRAINPIDLGLYSEEQYDRKDLGCSRFSADSEIPWIEGYDLYSGKTVLIPADFVYYPAIRKEPLVFDTSNGASAHTDTVQAILNGLFELIERDSFLTMWLNKFSMPILNLKKLPFGFSESVRLMKEFGISVKLVDMTGDTQIPAIAAVCYNKDPTKYPALLVGAGSHTDPEKAVQKALFEMEFMLSEMLEHPNKKKITHPHQITTMYEHPLYYLNPKMRKYWKFMISGKQTSKLPALRTNFSKDNHIRLTQIVKLLHNNKHRVVCVDLTPSDLKRRGLKSVKVFVTGFQPLYVGTELRLNLERLNSSAERIGRKYKADRNVSELNLAPHPLP